MSAGIGDAFFTFPARPRIAYMSLALLSPLPPPVDHVPLSAAVGEIGLSRSGLLKLLARSGQLVRHDGHFYVARSLISEIKAARELLGLGR
jgi:hypothetical protein